VRPLRLVALDLDGTLLGSDKRISARNRRAIDAARARGVHVVLVTGRRYPAARRVAEELGGDPPLVLHNGAMIVEERTVLRCRTLEREVALEAVRIARAAGADAVLHCGRAGEGRLLVEAAATSNTLLAYYLDRSHPDVTVLGDLCAELLEDPIQVMFGGGIPQMEMLLPGLVAGLGARVRIERTVYPSSGLALLDVLHPEVGKAEALVFLQRRWGLVSEETLAVGDNWNDAEMLKAAGVGLVMGNAEPGMLALGLPVLPTNDDDGVAVAIEQYVLDGN
jgi:hydroxymethylpyrimidine pyrophosphatase-like HAD family hydrolase